jgi:creatinine amidohydrolase/Fe(II)-dependent formamide hydrolase-like protein
MRTLRFVFIFALTFVGAHAQILHYAELNATQINALDRTHTAVIVTNGILEEHGPYLPSFIDGYWHEAIAQSLARAIVARPGWTAVMLPTIPLGTNPANIIGSVYSFPGSVTISHDTMRAVFMDLADALGDQGFRNIFVVDGHGGPTNSLALDAASDYFHDTFHGEMFHIMGAMPIFESSNATEEMLTPKQQAENGMSVHADALEESQCLFVRPDLVPAEYKHAPTLGAKDFPGLVAVASKPGWPGYLGAPSYASAALGARSFEQLTKAINALALDVLDRKTDPRSLPRYGTILFGLTTEIEKKVQSHEAEVTSRHNKWLEAHPALIAE